MLFSPPNGLPSVHICVYLPTHGLDSQFLDEITKLNTLVYNLVHTYPSAPIYIRGDFNVNRKNLKRKDLLDFFQSSFDFAELKVDHPTYHHFVGDGQCDSQLDKVFFSKNTRETLLYIVCKKEDPLVNISSMHDMLITSFSSPKITRSVESSKSNPLAPRIKNNRHKVVWSEEGIHAYQELLTPRLKQLQQIWLPAQSRTCLSTLIKSTNAILTSCAQQTNKTLSLSNTSRPKSRQSPPQLRKSARNLIKMWRQLRFQKLHAGDHPSDKETISDLTNKYNKARSAHRQLARRLKAASSYIRDSKLLKDTSATFARIRSLNRAKSSNLHVLKVGDLVFEGEYVPDGFHYAIKKLKTKNDYSAIDPSYCEDYGHILKICKTGKPIEQISRQTSLDILNQMKPNVSDFYSVTPAHYLNAGLIGCEHFFLLLTALIEDVNSTTIDEVNTTYACILFKGHKKDRTSARSYRTISTCPVIAKALDMYIRLLYIDEWNADQGPGRSHELAAVLLTECIQYSLKTSKLPLYTLYLDAKSAFDVVQKEAMIRNLYFTSPNGHALLYLNNRLENRTTYIDWSGTLMGPIDDEQGLEQGGVSSSDHYKIYSKNLLMLTQASNLGTKIGNIVISSIGEADDTVLLSNDLHHLYYLLQLTLNYCSKHGVNLCPEKTILQAHYGKDVPDDILTFESLYPIKINDKPIKLSSTAEHLGVVRSTEGNLPSLMSRFIAHKRAVASVLHTGLALGHRSNPASGLRIHDIYATPVLMSGLAALVLSDAEIKMIEQHYRETLRSIMRLYPKTPRSVVYFLAGSLPGSAILHLRQLSLFGMITRLKGSILFNHAENIFKSITVAKSSWFHQIRRWCIMYDLPHPLDLMSAALNKQAFKTLIKKRVVTYWETTLREEADGLVSLSAFKSSYMSLTKTHPLWSTAGYSPIQVSMATIQATMLSGRYRTEALLKHWSSSNKRGICLLSRECSDTIDSVCHILCSCPGLQSVRENLLIYTSKFIARLPPPHANVISKLCHPTNEKLCEFLLDCSSSPDVIILVQHFGQEILQDFFSLTRTWVFVLHRERLRLLGRWRRPGNCNKFV